MKKNNIRIQKPKLASVPDEIETAFVKSYLADPSEGEIREYAYHLFEHCPETSSEELDNWFEAKSRLMARIPMDHECARINPLPPELVGRTE